MKHILITTIAAVLLVGCGLSEAEWAIFDDVNDGDIEAVKKALADGVSVNVRGDMEWTPLHHASLYNHKEIAELLIDNGADVNAKAYDGKTPLHHATKDHEIEIAKLLISKGADVNAFSEPNPLLRSGTPLDMAVDMKQTKTADLLRKHGGKTGAELKAEGK